MQRDTAEPRVRDFPGERARAFVEYHHRNAAPSTYAYDFVWDRSAPAIGPFCTDVDGNVLMDFVGHVGAMPLGYNNPKLMDPLAAFDLVDPMKIAGQDFYVTGGPDLPPDVPGPTDLMDRLTDLSSQYDMDRVFLSNTGAEAVENALKISYDHTRGTYAVTFQGAFHGRTLGTLSLNRSKGVYRRHYPEIASVHDLPFCDDRTCDRGSCRCGFFPDEESSFRRMLGSKDGYVDPAEVACVVIEPIQGEGGYRIPSGAFMAEVAAVCAEYDLTLVVDEVQSGIGRTGEMWASDHFPIEPDVIASAKALRVGATISRGDVFPAERYRLSSTWGAGDILGAAMGALTLDAIEEYDLMANATDRGRQMQELLRDADLPGAVDVRGRGLMLAVEWASVDRRDAVLEAGLQRGLLTLGCGTKSIRMLPPLDATPREIRLGADLLTAAARDADGPAA
ncbi:MAG: aminotransferase class III-fold pyridoxal phosphate-dependent enzyme [Haloarculaceae archaeon]